MHSSHCNQTCVSIRQFSRPFWNVSSTTFQSPELLIQCAFIWKETMQLVSGKIEFNACQVSLLWHNSFLVSLKLFSPPSYFDYFPEYWQTLPSCTHKNIKNVNTSQNVIKENFSNRKSPECFNTDSTLMPPNACTILSYQRYHLDVLYEPHPKWVCIVLVHPHFTIVHR